MSDLRKKITVLQKINKYREKREGASDSKKRFKLRGMQRENSGFANHFPSENHKKHSETCKKTHTFVRKQSKKRSESSNKTRDFVRKKSKKDSETSKNRHTFYCLNSRFWSENTHFSTKTCRLCWSIEAYQCINPSDNSAPALQQHEAFRF